MFCWFSQQRLISFSATFVSSAAERIDLAIATNSPEALNISICGCFLAYYIGRFYFLVQC